MSHQNFGRGKANDGKKNTYFPPDLIQGKYTDSMKSRNGHSSVKAKTWVVKRQNTCSHIGEVSHAQTGTGPIASAPPCHPSSSEALRDQEIELLEGDNPLERDTEDRRIPTSVTGHGSCSQPWPNSHAPVGCRGQGQGLMPQKVVPYNNDCGQWHSEVGDENKEMDGDGGEGEDEDEEDEDEDMDADK